MLQKWALPVFINQVLGLLFSYNMNVLVLLHVLSFDKEYPGTCILCKYYAWKYLKAVIFYSALRNGGRYKWLWLTCILQGLTTEMVSYFLPDIDNFWHAQGMVMFAGQRLPLYIMVLCKLRFQIPFYLVGYTMVELCFSEC